MTTPIIPNSNKPLAFSYVRMSTDIQLKGDSLRRQKHLSEQYAEEHDLHLVEDFKLEDIGVSAFKGVNISSGALGLFLDAVKAKQVPKGSYLLVESLDRLSRQKVDESLSLFLDLTRNGINLVTLSDGQLFRAGDTDLQQLIYSIVIMSRAYEESEIKSQRLSAAWENKRNNIEDQKLTSICPKWLKLSDDRINYLEIPERVQVVRRIFEESASGIGAYSITRRLNTDHIPPFGRSEGWVKSYVTKILQNRSVLGEYQPHRKIDGKRVPIGDPIDGYFPQIIDETLFLRVQASRRDRQTGAAGRKGSGYTNLFTHLATCRYCGSPMHLINKGQGPKGGKYLKCSKAMSGPECVSSTWRYQDFETSFFHFVREIDLTETLRAFGKKSELASLEEQKIAASEKLAQLETRRDRALQLLDDADFPIESVRTRIVETEEQISIVRQKIAGVEDQIERARADSELDREQLEALIEEIRDTANPDNFEKRALIANRLRGVVTSLKLGVEGSTPFDRRIEQTLIANSYPPDEAQQIASHIEKVSTEFGSDNPTFDILLADGIARRVIVSKSDPTEMVAVATSRDGKMVELHTNNLPDISPARLAPA